MFSFIFSEQIQLIKPVNRLRIFFNILINSRLIIICDLIIFI